jgi:hypothetical protein
LRLQEEKCLREEGDKEREMMGLRRKESEGFLWRVSVLLALEIKESKSERILERR